MLTGFDKINYIVFMYIDSETNNLRYLKIEIHRIMASFSPNSKKKCSMIEFRVIV